MSFNVNYDNWMICNIVENFKYCNIIVEDFRNVCWDLLLVVGVFFRRF